MSQSPQTGQFNSYKKMKTNQINPQKQSLNPLKRVNSILTFSHLSNPHTNWGLNPLKRVNSILTGLHMAGHFQLL